MDSFGNILEIAMETIIKVTFACIAALVSTGAIADDVSTDKSRLQGVWTLSEGETNGRPLAEALKKKGLGKVEVAFLDDRMTMKTKGSPDHVFRFTLDPTTRPKTIQMIPLETHGEVHDGGGAELHGIYEIAGDKLKLCLPNRAGIDQQPKSFEAPAGSLSSLLVLHRQAEVTKLDAEQSESG